MAITRGATITTKAVASGSSTNFNITGHTTDTGTDYLVVFVFWSGATTATVSTITWNGVTLTSLGTATNTGAKVQVFGLAGPAIAGPATVTITMSASARGGAVAVNYLNGGVTLTTGTVATNTGGTNTTPTVTATSATGEVVIAGAACNNGDTTTVTAGSGQTDLANFIGSPGAGSNSGRELVSDEPGAASVVMDGTWSANRAWSTVAVPIKAAAVATTLAKNDGDAQSATVGTQTPIAPSVLITGAGSVPVPNVSVTFAIASGGGSLTGATVVSDALGIARVGSWTLGASPGANSITATSGVLTGSPATFTATGLASGGAAIKTQNGVRNGARPMAAMRVP